MTTPAQALDDSLQVYKDFAVQQKAASDELKANLATWNAQCDSGKDPFLLFILYCTHIYQNGYVNQDPAYKDKENSSLISVRENKLTSIGYASQYLSAFLNVNNDMQNEYNNAGDINKIQDDLKTMLASLPQAVDAGIIDPGTAQSIQQAIETLQGNFQTIQDKYVTIAAFNAAVVNKDDDTGAAGLAQSISQSMPTISQGVATQNQAINAEMTYETQSIKQFLSDLQQDLKMYNSQISTMIQNQSK